MIAYKNNYTPQLLNLNFWFILRLLQSDFERMFPTFLEYNDMSALYLKLGVLSRIPFGAHVTSKVGGLISTNHFFDAVIDALNIYPLTHK